MIDALLFDLQAFLELMAYVRSVSTEICGIGKLERDQFDIVHVTEIKILPQIVGGADANVTAADMEKFFSSLEDDSEAAKWCFNWHTHPTFSTTPSGTDLKNYKNLNDLFEVLVPMIFNQDGEYNGWVYHSHPVRQSSPINRIWIYEWKDHYQKLGHSFDTENQVKFIEAMFCMQNIKMDPERSAWLEDEVLEKVQKKVYTPPPTPVGNIGLARTQGSYRGYGGESHYPITRESVTSLVPVRDDDWEDAEITGPNDDFFTQESDTSIDPKYRMNPHNWSLADIIDDMEDYDFDWDEKQRIFFGRVDGKQVQYSVREAKDFLCSVIADLEGSDIDETRIAL